MEFLSLFQTLKENVNKRSTYMNSQNRLLEKIFWHPPEKKNKQSRKHCDYHRHNLTNSHNAPTLIIISVPAQQFYMIICHALYKLLSEYTQKK
jgi:hypothetical protein